MKIGFCLAAQQAAFRFGQPEIWNNDQGALDNVFIERLWRSLKYELIYPGDFAGGQHLHPALERHFDFYNHRRPHQALSYKTPADLFPRSAKRKRA